MLVPMTASLTETRDRLVLELSRLATLGCSAGEMERFAEARFRAVYGFSENDVRARLDGDNMIVNYRVQADPKYIDIKIVKVEEPVFTINEDEWADVPAGTTRAVPSEQRDTVRQQVWTGTQWRWIGSPFITYDAQINDVTAPVPSTESPQVAPSA